MDRKWTKFTSSVVGVSPVTALLSLSTEEAYFQPRAMLMKKQMKVSNDLVLRKTVNQMQTALWLGHVLPLSEMQH